MSLHQPNCSATNRFTDRGACGLPAIILLLGCLAILPPSLHGADLLDGEFSDIDVGRQLLEPARFPTVKEFRKAVQNPSISAVLMFKLFAGSDNHHLPVFSYDGQRLAFQRSNVEDKSSKLLVFSELSQADPVLLTDRPEAYDYMFRWAINSPGGLAFVRIDSTRATTQILFSPDGVNLKDKISSGGRHRFPALYHRTDGIWRMLYEQDDRLMHEAWNDEGQIGDPLMLAQATSPRWSRDGRRVLMARRKPQSTPAAYEMVVRDLAKETELLLPAGQEGTVRSPSWSPDCEAAAFYVREPGERMPWRIRVCPTTANAGGTTLGNNVVVNSVFESEGPAWEPSGRRIWFFSHEHQQQAYYPLVATDVQTGQAAVVDYPNRCTTPSDLAINTTSSVPEIAFVAHDGRPKDLFVVFLNHY